MTFKSTLLVVVAFFFVTPNIVWEDSRGKQQKYFPKELKSKDVYLGMTLAKFKKERPKAIADATTSEFKITYTESAEIKGIQSYTYLLTQTENPQLYAIQIAYNEMETVQPHAEDAMGKPNHKGEWRMAASDIKEDFMMGAWTFGHKLVYGATLVNSEWEKGFEN